MDNYKIFLASGSPRRKELLMNMGFNIEVVKVEVEESYPLSMDVKKIAEYISDKKLDSFLLQNNNFDGIVLTADTIVVKEGKVLEKPLDLNQAFDYLHLLSNSKHEVITGVSISYGKDKTSFSDISEVYFDEISDYEIKYYINNYDVLDKAGAYGVQEWIGHTKISKIVGSYNNIVGLPTQKVYHVLKEIIEKIN